MPNQQLSLALAKVMISAAWADGEVQPEEIECLKKFVMSLPKIDEAVWDGLDVYINMPIEEDERLQLVDDLKEAIRTEDDRDFVIRSLESLFMADGVISDEESYAIEQIRDVLRLPS